MDAKERLRRYLEQRREMGESDLVLDSMSVDEVLKIVGRGPAALGGTPGVRRSSVDIAPPPVGPQVAPDPLGGPPGQPSDWRSALRGGGDAGPEAPEMPKKPNLEPPAKLPAQGGALPDEQLMQLPSLEALADVVRKCTRCPLHLTAKQGVPGEGNPNARFMCVGEAPGATEDETGRPFVGAAGQLLTKILAAIDLRREDVFIANVIKHRPPGNRNPLPNEIAACSPYLVRQLELIKPGVILALGTFAAQTLLGTKESIGKLRGTVHRYHGIPLVVTYHPAALLRNPSWKRPTWEDVQLARRILDSSPVTGA